MNREQTNMELIKTLAHVQATLIGLDKLKDVSMHRDIKSILEDSKPVFKAVEKVIVKKWVKIYEHLLGVDEDMIEVIIEAYQDRIDKVVGLNIEDVVTIIEN